MKKLFVLFSLLVLTSCSRFLPSEEGASGTDSISGESEESTSGSSSNEALGVSSDIAASALKSYSNDELGISFKYPEGNVKEEHELTSIDSGREITLTVANFSLKATSADFGMGISEGCCYYFKGKSLDLTLSDEKVKAELEKQFGEVYEFERVKVDGKDAVRFVRINEYISSNPVVTVILPLSQSSYANIMFSGPDMGDFTKGENGDKPDRETAIAYVHAKTYKEDKEFLEKLGVFESVLATFNLN